MTPPSRLFIFPTLAGMLTILSAPLVAQSSSEFRESPPPAPAAALDTAPTPPPATTTEKRSPFEFSGVMFANFQYRLDRGTSRGANKFDVERVYLTFRMPAGERASVRLTTDLFQQTRTGNDEYYRGWILRAKYAYLQYDYLKRGGLTGVARLGLVHNVFIEHDESFWPRWIGTVAVDRHGFFSSSDAGLVTLVTFPRKRGELYATIVNGPGYTSRETDRFKDYAARLTLTPFAGSPSGFWRGLALTGWIYEGARASRFSAGGPEQVGPVGSSLERDRWGVFAAVKDPRITLTAQYASRQDEAESGENTAVAPRVVRDSVGSVVSTYALVRVLDGGKTSGSLRLLGRLDRVITHRGRGDRHHLAVAGLLWELNRAASLSLDYQELLPQRGSAVLPNKALFLHLVARY